MSDVSTTFTGDDRQIQAIYERLKRLDLEQIELKRRHAQAFKRWGEEQASYITGTIGGLFTLEKAIDTVTESYQKWREQIKEAGQESRALDQSVLSLVAKTADLEHLDELREKIAGSALGPEQAQSAYAGIRGRAPGLSYETAQQLLSEEGKLGPTEQGAGPLGGAAAALLERDKKLTPRAAMSLALKLRELSGDKFEELTSDELLRAVGTLRTSGAAKSQEEAFGLALEGLHEKMSPKMLERLAGAIGSRQRLRLPRPGERFTPTDVGWNRFYGTQDAQERLKLFFTDANVREAIGGERGQAAAKFSLGGAAQFTKQLTAAEADDVAAKAGAAVAGTATGQRVIREQLGTQTKKIGLEQSADVKADDYERRIEQVDEFINQERRRSWASRFFFGRPGPFSPEEQAYAQAIVPELAEPAPGRKARRDILFGDDTQPIAPAEQLRLLQNLATQHPEFREQIETAENLVRAMDRNTQAIERAAKPAPVVNAHIDSR